MRDRHSQAIVVRASQKLGLLLAAFLINRPNSVDHVPRRKVKALGYHRVPGRTPANSCARLQQLRPSPEVNRSVRALSAAQIPMRRRHDRIRVLRRDIPLHQVQLRRTNGYRHVGHKYPLACALTVGKQRTRN